MNDLEREIRQVLDEDARDAPLISSAPAGISRRVRRRQLRLAAVASLCTVAIGIGLFGAFRALTPSDDAVPGETGEATHPDEIASGSEPGLGSWWLTARRVNETPRLAFHRPDASISANIEPIAEGQTLGTDGSGAVVASTDADPGWWMVMGVVASDVARIEIQLDDGRSIVANLVPMPIEIIGPSKAYVALYQGPIASVGAPSPRGQVVAFDAAGVEIVRRDLTDATTPASVLAARMDLRNAFVAALTFYTDGATFVGFTPAVASTIEPSLTYNAATEAAAGEISIRDVSKDSLVLVTRAKDGSVWCIAEQDALSGLTTYGVVDAPNVAECVGGDAAWAISPSTATPSPSNSPSSTPSSLHGIASGTDLGETWTLSGSLDSEQYCLQLETGSTGSGTCSAAAQGGPPPGPPEDRPAQATTVRVSLGEFLVETVPNTVGRIEVTTSSGETFTGVCADPHLIPKLMSLGIRVCVVPLAGVGDGTMRFLTTDGAQAFPSESIAWNDEGSAGSTGSSGSSGP